MQRASARVRAKPKMRCDHKLANKRANTQEPVSRGRRILDRGLARAHRGGYSLDVWLTVASWADSFVKLKICCSDFVGLGTRVWDLVSIAQRILLMRAAAAAAATASKSEWLREEEQHDYNYHAREVYI